MTALEPDACLCVDVPVCAFRPYESREYQDTHPVPPPSAVYGMLLSLCGIGRESKTCHAGVALALAIQGEPERGRVFRKLRRGKELEDIRPDYQDLLLGLRLWIWLAAADDRANPPLPFAVQSALSNPAAIERSGGLSLGESSYLVDTITLESPDENLKLSFVVPDALGFYTLPVWIDHSTNQRRRDRFKIDRYAASDGLPLSWISITPPE